MVEICILGFFELFCSRDSNSYGFINLTIRTGLKFGSNQHKFIIMSNSQSADEQNQEWIVVTKNKNKHKALVKNKQIHGRGNQNILKAQCRQDYIQKFINAKSFQFNQKMLIEAVDKVQAISNSEQFHVECLGLGNFQSNKKCFIQLQFMELIVLPIAKEIIAKRQSIDCKQKSERPLFTEQELSVNVYDPAFTKEQAKLLSQLNYSSVEKFKIKKGKVNLFFMPHCERFLYEAVYQQYSEINDKSLTPLIVIGNSIQEYKDRCVLIKQKIPDIFLKIQLKQQRIFDFQNALNDTFILI